MSRSRVLRASVLSGVVFAAALTFASGHYTIEDLSALPGGSSVGAALNSSGQVVGWSGYRDGGNTYAFVWTHGVAMYSLRTLAGGDSSSASGINASGAVAGTSNTATSERAFLWTRTGGLKDLGVLPGDFSSSGSGLNDRGDVVGVSTGPQFGRPTLWMSGAAAAQSLASLPGEADCINNSRQVVGTVQTAQGKRAFLWSSGKGLTLLPPLAGDDSSAASRINQAGIVAGTSTGPRGTHAVLWNASGDVRDLGTLPSGTYSAAYDISDSGEAVGVSDTSLGARAFLWTAQGGMLDLNSAIPADANVLLTAAQAINSRGQIVAIGTMNHDPSNDRPSDMDDNEHAGPIHLFLLTPVGLP